ncbi:MAG: carboxypeptidase-like regulatory domain-containing protein [Candidatus Omnitrophica bacterium]|jgi:hypothetical protein|nr:carboxypeptidase-like regulatory domain-containing protein [Candidatus Omnitrophota bacterium]
MSNPDKNKRRDIEKPAVHTTIVGGRPPGCGKEIDKVPRGIEILVKKASVDPSFREILLKERAAAAKHINLCLVESEAIILNTISKAQLEGMILATKVHPNLKEVFLGCTAAVMLAALTTTVNASDDRREVGGIRPDDAPVSCDEKENPSFFKAEEDKQLETGILLVEVFDRATNKPVKDAKIYFHKHNAGEKPRTPTYGKGYTDEKGQYIIKEIPVGRFYILVSDCSGRTPYENTYLDIAAGKENKITFKVNKDNNPPSLWHYQTRGISPK